MPNQHKRRDWRKEIEKISSEMCLCVIVPNKLTALARVKFSCPHGYVKETTVVRLVDRQYCCKSQASKAHDPAVKSKASKIAWSKSRDLLLRRQKERWSKTEEKEKQSKAMLSSLSSLRETGWYNPGWGYAPREEERSLPGILYLIRYCDDSGTHFKLGITKLSLDERFRKSQLISIVELHRATLGECFDLEQTLLKWARENGHRYRTSSTTELVRPAAIPYLLEQFREANAPGI